MPQVFRAQQRLGGTAGFINEEPATFRQGQATDDDESSIKLPGRFFDIIQAAQANSD